MRLASSLVALLLVLVGTARAQEESPGRAHAHKFRADPLLVDVAFAVGLEPQDRGGDAPLILRSPLCFHFGGEALLRGLVGPALGVYASVGSPVAAGKDERGVQQPSLADRISVVAAVAVRPLGWLAWRRDDDWASRFAAGLGLQLGVAAEVTRTSLELVAAPGLHALLSLDVPIWGGGSVPGLVLRLAARLLVTKEQQLAPDTMGKPQVVEPGVAVQVFGGLAYYL